MNRDMDGLPPSHQAILDELSEERLAELLAAGLSAEYVDELRSLRGGIERFRRMLDESLQQLAARTF
jgi:hypothetical protein